MSTEAINSTLNFTLITAFAAASGAAYLGMPEQSLTKDIIASLLIGGGSASVGVLGTGVGIVASAILEKVFTGDINKKINAFDAFCGFTGLVIGTTIAYPYATEIVKDMIYNPQTQHIDKKEANKAHLVQPFESRAFTTPQGQKLNLTFG